MLNQNDLQFLSRLLSVKRFSKLSTRQELTSLIGNLPNDNKPYVLVAQLYFHNMKISKEPFGTTCKRVGIPSTQISKLVSATQNELMSVLWPILQIITNFNMGVNWHEVWNIINFWGTPDIIKPDTSSCFMKNVTMVVNTLTALTYKDESVHKSQFLKDYQNGRLI